MLSCLVSHHVCEIVSCYLVWLDNINVNYFMACFLPYYPLHLSILQCLYINYFSCLSAISIGGSDVSICGSKNTVFRKDRATCRCRQNHGCTCPRTSPTTHNPHSCRLYPYPVGQRTSYTPSNPNPSR